MFTGIVEEIGTIQTVRPGVSGAALVVRAPRISAGARAGDSIAINGACLTVEEINGQDLQFHVGAETLARTTAGQWRPGSRVNIEQSLRADSHMGGHFVQGHVDCVGRLESRVSEGQTARLTFSMPTEMLAFVAPRGSVAVNGVSLTVTGVTPAGFSVAIIPYTMAETNLPELQPGDVVNVETDVLARYLDRMLRQRGLVSDGLTEEFLAENGFM